MKINDAVLVAFLVSAGLFSTVQAKQYIATLSAGEKLELLTVASTEPTVPLVPVDPAMAASGSSAEGARRLA